MNYALLVPCYEPGEEVTDFIRELSETLPADIFIVDDGSGPAYIRIFQTLLFPRVTVVSYRDNHGKGYALRTGIRTITDSGTDYDYIITADADGQHTPSDIKKIAAAASAALSGAAAAGAPLILGVRDFTEKNVPPKSRLGNRFSSIYFRFVTGVSLADTQTGLRAIPARLFDAALETPGDRYDYEMNFLIGAAKSVRTVPIRTVYEKGNRSSHFRAFRDSVQIYRTPLRYILVSLTSAAVDLTLFTILASNMWTPWGGILVATVLARMVSGIVNFSLNRAWSFSSIRAAEGTAWQQALKYLVLFVGQMLASSGLVTLLSHLPLPVTLVKMIVDTGLAFISYQLQHNWVFKSTGKCTPGGAAHDHERSMTCRKSTANGTEGSDSSMGQHSLLSRFMSFLTLSSFRGA